MKSSSMKRESNTGEQFMEKVSGALAGILKLVFLMLLLHPIVAQAANPDDGLRKVTLQLKWKHQFQFAGYYAAVEKGFFKEAGLEVALVEAKGGVNPNDAVLEGKAEFGISTTSVLALRAEHKNVVVLASVLQHSPLVLLALERSGIKHVRDLIGKKIALEHNAGEIITYLQHEGVSLDQCVLKPQTYDLKQLINGEVDAISAYETEEPFLLEEAGIPYTVLSPAMAGIDFYGDVLYTTRELIDKDPLLVKNFRGAALKGWKYAMDHPEEIVDIILKNYSQNYPRSFYVHEAEHIKSLIVKDVVQIGYSNPERWQHILETYQKAGFLDRSQTIAGLLYDVNLHSGNPLPWNFIIPFTLVLLLISSATYFFYHTSRKLRHEIQVRQEIEKELHQNEELYDSLLKASPDTILMTDLKGVVTYISTKVESMFGYPAEEVVNQNITKYLEKQDRKRAMETLARSVAGERIDSMQYMAVKADGARFPIEVTSNYIRHGHNTQEYMVHVVRDITQRRLTQEKLLKSSRTHAFISQINQAIVQMRDREWLLDEICKIAIETGKFRMAWVGFIDKESGLVVPAAFSGFEDGYLSYLKTITIQNLPQGQGPTGTAIREDEPCVCENIEHDSKMGIWKAEALRRGYHSSISLPIREFGVPTGALTLYAPVVDFFDQEEISLLQEVTDNLSFALDALETDKEVKDLYANLEIKIEERTRQLAEANATLLSEIEERKRIEQALSVSEQNYRTVVENIKEVIFYTDAEGLWSFLNKSWTEITGFGVDESLGKSFLDFVHPDDREKNWALFLPLVRREKEYCRHEIRYLTKEGGFRWIEVFARLALNDQNEEIGTYGTLRDITERKFAEDFENEMLQLSPKLTGIPLAEVDKALNLALERIGLFLMADRAYIFELDDEKDTMSNTFEWCNEGITPQIENLRDIPCSALPMWMKELRQHNNIVIPQVQDLPESWQAEKEVLEPQLIKSLIVIPMVSENKLIGFVGLDSVERERAYSSGEINILTVWSSMLAGLINNKRAELLLEHTRQNYETFFNTIGDFLWVFDQEGRILHVNATVRNRLGFKDEDLVNQPITAIHPSDRQEEVGRIVTEMLAQRAEVCTVPFVTREGMKIPVETRIRHGFWNNQSVLFGVSKDMSQLELSEQKFSSAFQSNAAMMSIANSETGKILDINSEFCETLGYSKEEVVGQTGKKLKIFVDARVWDETSESLKRDLPIRKKVVQFRTKNGTVKSGLLSCDTIYIGNDRCQLCVLIDITERIQAEEDTRKARQEAEEANQAKSEFLSRMSHELRTPMNSILGFAQLLDMSELNSGQRKGVKHILNSGKHLLDLINEVLDISRIEAGRLSLSLEPVPLQGVIQETMDFVRQHATDREINLELIETEALRLAVRSDLQRLKQILLNLLSNAVKYNRKGGSVKVEVRRMERNNVGDIPVRISIRDTGPGIAARDIPKLFNPFERIGAERTDTEGTGLGLSVVKKLVLAMGGNIGVDSVLGRGSTFWIEFPLTEMKMVHAENAVEEGEPVQDMMGKTGLILYIEDNLSNVELVEEVLALQRSSIRLITHTHGSNAVGLAGELNPGLILLDLNLPDIHGSEVLKLLLEDDRTRSIPVVVISADAMSQQIKSLLDAGARYYLTKPLEVELLLKVIDEFIH